MPSQLGYPLSLRGQVCRVHSPFPCFPPMALSSRRLPSLVRVPASPVPRCQRYYEGATTSHPRISGRLWLRSRRPPVPPWFVFAAALLTGRRSLPGPGFGGAGRPSLQLFPMGADGISQVSRQSILCLCSAPRPRSNQRVLAIAATSMLPPLPIQRRLRQLLFRGSLTQLRHLLTYASRFVSPLTRKARFRLAGWPLPGGRRTLWTAMTGFSSC